MAEEDSSKLHIAMFPWLAFGHMNPFLELAKLIAQKGHKISFISTPRNIDRLPKLPPSLSSSIHFIKLPLPQVENLSENAEATTDLPLEKVPYLKIAFDGLQNPMAKFLETSSPDWLVFDFAPHWLPPLAHNLGIPSAYFCTFTASALAQMKPSSPLMAHIQDDRSKPEDLTKPPKWIPFPNALAFRIFEIQRFFDAITGVGNDDSEPSDIYRSEQVIQHCDAIFVRSSREWEPEYLDLLHQLHYKPIIPTGQLPPVAYYNNYEDDDEDEGSWKPIKGWLDKQERGSVVYVAFGSEADPSEEELTEIALGLELSGLPFFWVLRTRPGAIIELPDGFEDRTKGRGVVWKTWAPQVKILAHESVGGFLSHAGWSSVVEAITFQRPLILLTFLFDQGLNARVLEEQKMGYAIPRDDIDGTFTRDSVAESLRLVVVEKAGQVYRDNVKKMKGVFGDPEIQGRYVDQLLNFLATNKNLVSHPRP